MLFAASKMINLYIEEGVASSDLSSIGSCGIMSL